MVSINLIWFEIYSHKIYFTHVPYTLLFLASQCFGDISKNWCKYSQIIEKIDDIIPKVLKLSHFEAFENSQFVNSVWYVAHFKAIQIKIISQNIVRSSRASGFFLFVVCHRWWDFFEIRYCIMFMLHWKFIDDYESSAVPQHYFNVKIMNHQHICTFVINSI